MFKTTACHYWTDLLVSVAFPYVDTGQVGYNVCPQFLVRGELQYNSGHMFKTREGSSRRQEKTKRKIDEKKQYLHYILTRNAVVNCASALSIQFTEIQYRPWGMKRDTLSQTVIETGIQFQCLVHSFRNKCRSTVSFQFVLIFCKFPI